MSVENKTEYLLEVENLKIAFPAGGGLLGKNKLFVHAVDGVSFCLRPGETLYKRQWTGELEKWLREGLTFPEK